MNRVFVSYSRRNRAFAERLARDLSDAGLDVWIDFRQIHGGEMWEQEIYKGIERAEIVVVCLSPAAVRSEWVQREVNTAREQKKFILPVMVENALPDLEATESIRWLTKVHFIGFEARYEEAFPELLKALPGKRRVGTYDSVDPRSVPNPFKGLEAFQQTDAPFFFGRESLIKKSLDRLRQDRDTRFLAVVGASGSGKSSLVRAGVLPAIRNGALPNSEHWRIAIFTPGERPVTALANRLSPLMESSEAKAIDSMLHETDDFFDVMTDYVLEGAMEDARLLLVVDQFEEVFTRATVNEAERFIDILHHAVTRLDGRAHVLITMRADFFDRVGQHPELAAIFEQENMVIVTEMMPPELLRSIEGPAQAVGLVYDAGLPQRILEEVRSQPGSLPLLQYALKELYLRREGLRLTTKAYEEIGGVRRALAQHAETVYTQINTAQQAIMRRLLLRLIEITETGEATRRRVTLKELTFRDVPDVVVQELIDMLTSAESRLLIATREITTRGEKAEPQTFIEVSHEALIREWDRFQNWIADNVENLRHGGEILQSATDWQHSGRDNAYLLTGNRLARAEEWLDEADASPLQREFIQASVAEEERREQQQQAQIERELNLQRKAATRLRLFAIVLVIAFIGAIGLTLVTISAQREAEDQRALANQREQDAIEAAQLAQENARRALSLALSASANRALSDEEGELAAMLAVYANDITQIADPPPQSQRMLADVVFRPGTQRLLDATGRTVGDVAFWPDRETVTGATGNSLTLWNLEDGAINGEIGNDMENGHTATITAIDYSGDGALLATGDEDGLIIIWDTASGTPRHNIYPSAAAIRAVALSSDGRFLAAGDADGWVRLWNAETGTLLSESLRHTGPINAVDFSPDGRFYAAASDDMRVGVWSTSSGFVQYLNSQGVDGVGHNDRVLSVAFSPSENTNFLISGGADNAVIQWNYNTGREVTRFEEHTVPVTAVTYAPDAQSFFSGDESGSIIWWDAIEREAMFRFGDHTAAISGLAVSLDTPHLLSASTDRTIRVTDIRNAALSTTFDGHTRFRDVVSLYSADDTRVLSGSEDGTLRLWDRVTGLTLQDFNGHEGGVVAIDLSPDGTLALSGGFDGRVILWDTATGTRRFEMTGHTTAVQTVRFITGGAQALSADADGRIIRWDTTTGTELMRYGPSQGKDQPGHTGAVNSIAVDPMEQYIFSASDDASLIVWDLNAGTVIADLKGHNSAVATVAFDTTGERAVSGAQNGSIIVWDMTNIADENRTTSRILQRFLNAHDDRIVGIAFSPTGDQVVTSSEDGTLRLWDTDRGIELRRFAIDSGERFTGLDVTTSGQTVLTGLSTGIVQEWRLLPQPADLLAWMGTFRFVKEPDCTERARFQIEPLCVNDEQQAEPITLPTLTPGTEVPETLLAPGDMAVINMVTDESLFVRSEPSLSANPPVSQLYDGDQVLVLDGPVQADNLTWWRIRMADGTEGWSAERLPEEAVQAIVPLG